MEVLNNLIPLGFNKKNKNEFKKLNLKCYAIIDNDCKKYLYKIFNHLTNNFSENLYVEIQGEDIRLKEFINSNNLKKYKFTPMKSTGFLKFKLGTLQFFSNNYSIFNNIISLWDSELFFRVILFYDNINSTFELSCSNEYILLLKQSKIVITQSGDGDEIEIIEPHNNNQLINKIFNNK